MAIITEQDIYKKVYRGIVDEVTRFEGEEDEENPAVTDGIDSAIKEVKMYLSRFDLVKLFGTDDVAATIADAMLKNLCINIAVFHILSVGGSTLDYELSLTKYKAAISTLKGIQSGDCMPEGWPYLDTTGEDVPNGNSIEWTSNPKRNYHF